LFSTCPTIIPLPSLKILGTAPVHIVFIATSHAQAHCF